MKPSSQLRSHRDVQHSQRKIPAENPISHSYRFRCSATEQEHSSMVLFHPRVERSNGVTSDSLQLSLLFQLSGASDL